MQFRGPNHLQVQVNCKEKFCEVSRDDLGLTTYFDDQNCVLKILSIQSTSFLLSVWVLGKIKNMNWTRLLTMRHVVTDHAISRYIFEHGNNYQNVLLHSMKTLGRYFFLARLVLYITYIVLSNSSSI